MLQKQDVILHYEIEHNHTLSYNNIVINIMEQLQKYNVHIINTEMYMNRYIARIFRDSVMLYQRGNVIFKYNKYVYMYIHIMYNIYIYIYIYIDTYMYIYTHIHYIYLYMLYVYIEVV